MVLLVVGDTKVGNDSLIAYYDFNLSKRYFFKIIPEIKAES